MKNPKFDSSLTPRVDSRDAQTAMPLRRDAAYSRLARAVVAGHTNASQSESGLFSNIPVLHVQSLRSIRMHGGL